MTPAIFGISGFTLTADERAFFTQADPAGYVLFGRNVQNPSQLRALTNELRAIHGREKLFIGIDQEGGRVARMRPPEWSPFPAGAAFDALYDVAPSSAIVAARANAQALGMELADAGITVDFHPPLDVRQPGAHDVIGDRALGSEPMRVAALGRAILEGLADAGVAGCIKHMPGHGRSQCDTHKEMPTITASEAELETDIAPFRALNWAPMGMTGHLLFTAWDTENPATLSSTVIERIIRNRIGFDGLLLTDDIDMEALDGSIPDRSARAIAAGCDLVLNCWARMDEMVGIAECLPEITPRAAERLDRALAGVGQAQAADRSALLATRDELLALAEVSV
ncbi:MAG: beta-N-acetylhexosaminidase [Tsuneonella suprasediminis]|uniref:beta-N-acetylhexosaminidase n=1 Tax=Tsuneonella suprasediminis TaxID=2306996 RepID=A0A419R2P3_9SPHN|nr:beta-N-acetylhexosaminidase [Tsuneonella suprasediminis]RJX68079.1 beta-N-acetylhexosaminidase [Tsuneonella suprasediminis]UBS32953.1 beta-N-acetylhexosaminidase [Altererythrobacter sp. N1]